MIDKPNSPLRQGMIEDMTARRVTEKVQKDYIRHIWRFAIFLGRSPDTATAEDAQLYQLHLAKQQIGAPTINLAVVALRFFFDVTLERPELARHLAGIHRPRKAPVVLNQEEMAHLLDAAPGLKYKAALGVAYSVGLRVSEVVALKVSGIDSKRMTLRIEQGSAALARNIERIRALLPGDGTSPQQQPETVDSADSAGPVHKCPCCGGRMIIIETFDGVRPARSASYRIRIVSS